MNCLLAEASEVDFLPGVSAFYGVGIPDERRDG
jgi:hypothetical protein